MAFIIGCKEKTPLQVLYSTSAEGKDVWNEQQKEKPPLGATFPQRASRLSANTPNSATSQLDEDACLVEVHPRSVPFAVLGPVASQRSSFRPMDNGQKFGGIIRLAELLEVFPVGVFCQHKLVALYHSHGTNSFPFGTRGSNRHRRFT